MTLPFEYPLEPMLCKASEKFPDDGTWLFEPKWDGFRTLVFRDGEDLYLQSRMLKPLLRYFPEIGPPLLAQLPDKCVLDGELVVAQDGILDFGVLQMRLHPAKSRVEMLAQKYPCAYIAFDVLAVGDDDLRERPMHERRAILEDLLKDCAPPIHLTPMTRDLETARDWFVRFEGAGLDGVIAKPETLTYQPKKRAMLKLKHRRTADCVVAGFRWHKKGPGTHVGSLMLGLNDDDGKLQHVGVTSSFTMKKREELVEVLAPLREGALDDHPWASWAESESEGKDGTETSPRDPRGMGSRWNPGKSLSWEPLKPVRVVEVRYDHMQNGRFRHSPTFVRWRDDREPVSCGFDQLEVTPPYELAKIFGQ